MEPPSRIARGRYRPARGIDKRQPPGGTLPSLAMRLPSAALRELHAALVEVHADRGELARTVLHLDQRLNVIAGDGGLNALVYDVMMWAEAEGRLEDLCRAARLEHPAHQQLATTVRTLLPATEGAASATAPTAPHAPAPPPPAVTPDAVRVFIARTRNDEAACRSLRTHLAPLVRVGRAAILYDGALEDADPSALAQVEEAQVLVLLASAAFLASDACWDLSVRRAMHLRSVGLRVVPVYLTAAAWRDVPFGSIRGLPAHTGPISAWSDREAAFAHVVDGLRAVFDEVRGARPTVSRRGP